MSNERSSTSSDVSAENERARLRRNQRNSRARKQAYVQDLERRWSECVRLGAQATVEMQREARRVQEENGLLRALLRGQGLDDGAIQRALITAASRAEADEVTAVPEESPKCLVAGGGGGAVERQPAPPPPPPPRGGTQCCSVATIAPSQPAGIQQSQPSLAAAAEMPPTTTENYPTAPLMSGDLQTATGIVSPQELNFEDWLTDLCNLKDAFGADMFIADQPSQSGLDWMGETSSPEDAVPRLSVEDSQRGMNATQTGSLGNDIDLLPKDSCGWDGLENPYRM